MRTGKPGHLAAVYQTSLAMIIGGIKEFRLLTFLFKVRTELETNKQILAGRTIP